MNTRERLAWILVASLACSAASMALTKPETRVTVTEARQQADDFRFTLPAYVQDNRPAPPVTIVRTVSHEIDVAACVTTYVTNCAAWFVILFVGVRFVWPAVFETTSVPSRAP